MRYTWAMHTPKQPDMQPMALLLEDVLAQAAMNMEQLASRLVVHPDLLPALAAADVDIDGHGPFGYPERIDCRCGFNGTAEECLTARVEAGEYP